MTTAIDPMIPSAIEMLEELSEDSLSFLVFPRSLIFHIPLIQSVFFQQFGPILAENISNYFQCRKVCKIFHPKGHFEIDM
jgi:hypothetical protein